MKCWQNADGMPLPYKRPPVPLAGNHFYYKMGRPRMVLMVVNKGQKPYKNYVEDPMGETYNPII